ncbi:vesicle transport protein SEC20 isoform X1 [Mustela erminea]|uniref:vesicle transport protein SEC20 isoform X1 n=1 Tax=Mustela erminea TaxID=36723 RepID=UPI0013867F1A|nr:vesicle transport protein SEC20 isoform X1 [Mustela erminea]
MGACICPFLSGPWGTWSHCLWCWDLKTCDFPVTWPQMLLTTSAVQQRTICFKPGRKTGHSEIELEQSAKEQDKESEKQVLLQEVENHKKQMLSNQTSWRKANLTCKIAIDNLEKAQLLQGGDLLRQRKTTKESLAQTSSAITESLMGISRMMSQQVQQSEEAMQTLANSSRTILDANEEFKSMSGTIQLGRKLITKYNRRELTDKLLIFLALALFLATVLYIVKKRLFPFL